MDRRVALGIAAVALIFSGCAQQPVSSYGPYTAAATADVASGAVPYRTHSQLAEELAGIQHVVIIVQENRSVDNLFNGLPGADTVQQGLDSNGHPIPLAPVPLTAPYDLDHAHGGFLIEYNSGALNGFNHVQSTCNKGAICPQPELRAYGYVPEKEVQPYFDMAEQYTFADRMFQTNEGPSFPAHQYILSGTSTISKGSPLRASENPVTPNGQSTGGCDSPPGSLVDVIAPDGSEYQKVYPCFDRPALPDLIQARGGLTWRYYQSHTGPGLWEAPDAIVSLRDSPQFQTNVVVPSVRILDDIAHGNLANVSWVIPTAAESDHAGVTDGTGPSWVTAVVNAVGESRFWNNTAIIITWDDWGGWYDHVLPPRYNTYELGFRVPLIVISPYAKQHYISHQQHEFGSILKFVEETFGLGSLGTTDVRADDLSDCFDFTQPPTKFHPINAPFNASYFHTHAIDNRSPDTDF
jgi:phospholipase C